MIIFKTEEEKKLELSFDRESFHDREKLNQYVLNSDTKPLKKFDKFMKDIQDKNLKVLPKK